MYQHYSDEEEKAAQKNKLEAYLGLFVGLMFMAIKWLWFPCLVIYLIVFRK